MFLCVCSAEEPEGVFSLWQNMLSSLDPRLALAFCLSWAILELSSLGRPLCLQGTFICKKNQEERKIELEKVNYYIWQWNISLQLYAQYVYSISPLSSQLLPHLFTQLGHSPVCHWRAHNCYWLFFSALCACSRPQPALPLQPAGLMLLPPTCPSQQREFIRGVGSKGWKGEIRGERRACLPSSWLSNNPLFSLWWMERQGPLSLLHAWKTGIWRQTEKYLSKALVKETPTHDFVCSFSACFFSDDFLTILPSAPNVLRLWIPVLH